MKDAHFRQAALAEFVIVRREGCRVIRETGTTID
jgi:hypothetical protein